MRAVILLACMVLVATTPRVCAQASTPVSSADLDTVKADLERVKSELGDVKRQLSQLLQIIMKRPAVNSGQRVPAVRVRTDVAESPVMGRQDAPVTLVEFSDYQCPFCQRFFSAVLPELKRDYIDTGKVRYIFKDYPLEQIHAQAQKAAEAARCAGDQGKYWEMHDQLFRHQQTLSTSQLSGYAGALALDTTEFDACLTSGKYVSLIETERTDGTLAGFQGTPGFIVAKTTANNAVEGTAVHGAQPVTVFRALIDDLLHENQ